MKMGLTIRFLMPVLIIAFLHGGISPAKANDGFQQNSRLGRGVNLLGWDPIWQPSARSQFKETHFQLIREAGFNHVRINLHPLRDGKPDVAGKLRPEFFQTMDWAIDRALTNQLMVILDFHDDLVISPTRRANRKNSWMRGGQLPSTAKAARTRSCSRFSTSLRLSSRMNRGRNIGEQPWRLSAAPIPIGPSSLAPPNGMAWENSKIFTCRRKTKTSLPRCITTILFRLPTRERPGRDNGTKSA